MLTLFMDTHNENLKISIVENETVLVEENICENQNHSTICMPTLIKILNTSHTNIQDITDIIVVNGPGSFTGERLGVTIAKTIAYTLKKPIRTITSIETTLASINITEDTYLALKEKNGYFLAKFNKNKKLINDYIYQKKDEFQEFAQKNKIILCGKYDTLRVVKYAHENKKQENPHKINPFYVKKIEVEK